MKGYEISRILTQDPRAKYFFRGVFPRDVLKTVRVHTNVPNAFVINTDTQYESGEHWVVVWIHRGHAEYFDSYGRDIHHPDIRNFIKSNSRTHRFNRRIIQSPIGKTCGYYCVYYVKKKARGYSLERLLLPFHPYNYYINDQKILSMFGR